MPELEALEKQILRVESLLIALAVILIASGDYFLGQDVTLGYLYLIPLSYSALSQRWPITAALTALCVALRQWFGPLERSSDLLIVRDWALTAVFAALVVLLLRFGRRRRAYFEQARRQRDELVREVRLAAEVQQGLLDKNRPPREGFDIAAQTFPAKGVGGDYYDFFELEDGSQLVVIADVAGKGLAAAMLMPAVQIALRALAGEGRSLEASVAALNKVLCDAFSSANYATLFVVALRFDSPSVRYVNAGHLPGAIVSTSRREVRWLETGGVPVGLLSNAAYRSEAAPLEAHEALLLYTDGFTETENAAGEQFGSQRLADAALSARSGDALAMLRAVNEALVRFRASPRNGDDRTLIVIRPKR